jgi:hypothetical protein
MHPNPLLSLLLIASILSSCTVMNEQQCAYSDWTAVGYEDGADGRGSDRFGDYQRACTDFGITPDFQAWQQGRNQGLLEYCQAQRGFQVGQYGGSYNGVCNSDTEPDFLEGYRLGSELYGLRSQLSAIESQITTNQRALEDIDRDVSEIEDIIVLEETTREERAALLADMRELSEVRGELELEAELLIEQRVLAELALEQFELTLIDAGF